jgi:hypothetical protein
MIPKQPPKLTVFSELVEHRRRRRVCIFIQDGDREWIGRLSFEKETTNSLIDETEITIPAISPIPGLDGQNFLQTVLDHAWEQGLRPSGFFDTPNELAAIKRHLDDMRALAFKNDLKPKTY